MLHAASKLSSAGLVSRQQGVRTSDQSQASFSGRGASQHCFCCYSHSHQPAKRLRIFPASGNEQHGASFTCYATKSERRRPQPEASEEESRAEGQTSLLASGKALVNTLLFGAASRIERGTSVCVSCKGTGTMMCKECDATGIVKAKKKSSGKDSGGRMKSLMGTKSKEKEFIVSNRCRNCRGHGRLECPDCDGMGKRNIVQKDMWM